MESRSPRADLKTARNMIPQPTYNIADDREADFYCLEDIAKLISQLD
jgi:hypothetical protein